MSEPYYGEIRMFAGEFAPTNWELCQGQTLQISENDTLFSLIGTTYGGDGETTFKLPNLQSRFPVHVGTDAPFSLGNTGGAEEVTLSVGQLPAHSHQPTASSGIGTAASPSNAVWAAAPDTPFTAGGPDHPMSARALTPVGNGGSHENLPPYFALNFIICVSGIVPSPT
jgi:microcystin-dependent protein